MQNILMFVDSGVDDSIALMYALLNPKLNVVGVVSGYGNITKEQSIMNTAYLLQLAGREDIPIIAGVAGPLSGEPTTFYPEIHGKEGLGPIRPPSNLKNVNVYDIDKIIQIVQQYKRNLIIVGVGRLTDLALPFIIYGKDAFKDVSAFYIMGGAFFVPGNVTPEAEANFYADTIAADSVMEKARNIHLYPLNITNKAIITPDVIEFIAKNSTSPFKDLIKPAFDFYFEAYKKLVPGIKGAPLHDVVPLSALTNPDMVKYIPKRVRVELYGKLAGKTIADFRPKPEEVKGEQLDWIGMEMDLQQFILDFIEIFMSAKKR
ncbi:MULTISPECIES: nucleoside hydrolase [unclassified Bacillus (in: firmicutes)]|uniref:nucleoside hydrolase n=1 Tax=unclassified Bacillus (in: firmicutes) TaxID=185979 RepID=UPI0008E16BCD|nr:MULTISPECIES: nucleoside hydrolase [unclassified Bacillus (in: firmicutes)]SFA91740.1 purine nucleosidase [Bacillus sp. UNCCL13]SFQ85650.1 purine nucleosidase [Bacillus sp. cl95]